MPCEQLAENKMEENDAYIKISALKNCSFAGLLCCSFFCLCCSLNSEELLNFSKQLFRRNRGSLMPAGTIVSLKRVDNIFKEEIYVTYRAD